MSLEIDVQLAFIGSGATTVDNSQSWLSHAAWSPLCWRESLVRWWKMSTYNLAMLSGNVLRP